MNLEFLKFGVFIEYWIILHKFENFVFIYQAKQIFDYFLVILLYQEKEAVVQKRKKEKEKEATRDNLEAEE